jgi:hypothetical protein
VYFIKPPFGLLYPCGGILLFFLSSWHLVKILFFFSIQNWDVV